MTTGRRSLKFKLPVSFVLVFAAVQVALWLSVHVVQSRQLYNRLDAELLNRAQSVISLFEAQTTDKSRSADAAPLSSR